jgi:hypothetical protein
MSDLSLDDLFVRKTDLVATDMDGDTVVMSLEQQEYYGISGVGSRIWELLEKPIKLSEIIDTIFDEFEVDEAKCQTDAQKFIQDLLDYGTVTKA